MADPENKPKFDPETAQQLAELAMAIAHNPKTRKGYTKLVREIYPDRRFADVETDEIREDIKKEFEQRDLQRRAEETKRAQESARASLITSGRFKEEDVQKIEKEVMEKHGISDYEVAAKVYNADLKPARPTPEVQSRTWNMPTVKKGDLDNLGKIALEKAYGVVDEITSKRVLQ